MILSDNGKILISPDGKVYKGGSVGDNIKTVEIQGVYIEEDDCFTFVKENILIDIFKNIRMDFYLNGNWFTSIIGAGLIDFGEYGSFNTIVFQDLEDPNNSEALANVIYYYCLQFDQSRDGSLPYGEFRFDYNNAGFNANDNFIVKLHYIEPNELARAYFVEM